MCYNGFTIKIKLIKYKRFKDGRCRYRIIVSSQVNWNKLALICFMVNSIASTKLETFESNILLE